MTPKIDLTSSFRCQSQCWLHYIFVILLLGTTRTSSKVDPRPTTVTDQNLGLGLGPTSSVDSNEDHCTEDNSMCSRFHPKTVGDSVLTLSEKETKGKRVFVIGDVHGCYDELKLLLHQCNALRTNDVTDGLKDDVIIVFVGDLVNKGPNSKEVLLFAMSTKGVYSVRGNHEEYWLDGFRKGSEIDYLKKLPYVISILEHDALIVHAGFMPDIEVRNQRTEDIVNMRNILTRATLERVAYSETDMGVHWATLWKGPQHVYFGHDARRGQDEKGNPRVQRFPLATGLDTRCVKGGALTALLLPVETEQFYSVKCKQVYSLR